jgi:Glycosyl transferase family 2
MVQREGFSRGPAALRHLIESTPQGTRHIFVDAGSGSTVAAELRAIAFRHDVLLLRSEQMLAPQESRALAVPYVDSPYVVFIDNDAFGEPDWLANLVKCADETGAWLVGPLYGIGHPNEGRVHMAGGRNRLVTTPRGRELDEAHLYGDEELISVLSHIDRRQTELIEFHCVLMRTSALSTIPIDVHYLAVFEHSALCLRVLEDGGQIWLEPSSRVTYWPQSRPTDEDCAYFRLRWSPGWVRASAEHFSAEFDIPPDNALQQAQVDFAFHHIRRVPPAPDERRRSEVFNSFPSKRHWIDYRRRGEKEASQLRRPSLTATVVHRATWANRDVLVS